MFGRGIRLGRRRGEGEEETYQLPISMIDVVFMLLIFFILTLRFRVQEERLDAKLPPEGRNIGPTPMPKPEIRVKIWLDGDGRPAISVDDYPCSKNDLMDDLARRLAAVGRHDRTMDVLIDGRQEVPFWAVLGAVDAAKRAGLANVKFLAPPVPGGGGDDWYYQ